MKRTTLSMATLVAPMMLTVLMGLGGGCFSEPRRDARDGERRERRDSDRREDRREDHRDGDRRDDHDNR